MTPDNGIYYHIAYIIVALVYLGYGLRLELMRRRLVKQYDGMSP